MELVVGRRSLLGGDKGSTISLAAKAHFLMYFLIQKAHDVYMILGTVNWSEEIISFSSIRSSCTLSINLLIP